MRWLCIRVLQAELYHRCFILHVLTDGKKPALCLIKVHAALG